MIQISSLRWQMWMLPPGNNKEGEHMPWFAGTVPFYACPSVRFNSPHPPHHTHTPCTLKTISPQKEIEITFILIIVFQVNKLYIPAVINTTQVFNRLIFYDVNRTTMTTLAGPLNRINDPGRMQLDAWGTQLPNTQPDTYRLASCSHSELNKGRRALIILVWKSINRILKICKALLLIL